MAKLKAEGFGAVLGPMDGNTWGKHRLVVESDGRAPFLMEPANPAHYVEAFEQSGLEDRVALCVGGSACGCAAECVGGAAGVAVAEFRSGARRGGADAHSRAVAAKRSPTNHFYQPIALEDFLASYRPVLKAIDPELVLLAGG